MPIGPLYPPLAPELVLTADHVRAVLDACGYHGTAVRLGGTWYLAEGCRVSLQFGDLTAASADGAPGLTVRCSIVINGSEASVSGVSSWQIRKVFPALIGTVRLNIEIEADLLLGSGVLVEELLPHSDEISRHLLLLIADLRATLQELPIHDGTDRDINGPVLRIEARFAGDLVTGRSGIVGSHPAGSRGPRGAVPRTTTRHLQMATAACDCLANNVIPDLTRTIQRPTPQRSTRPAAPQDRFVGQTPSHPSELACLRPRTGAVSPKATVRTKTLQ